MRVRVWAPFSSPPGVYSQAREARYGGVSCPAKLLLSRGRTGPRQQAGTDYNHVASTPPGELHGERLKRTAVGPERRGQPGVTEGREALAMQNVYRPATGQKDFDQ